MDRKGIVYSLQQLENQCVRAGRIKKEVALKTTSFFTILSQIMR